MFNCNGWFHTWAITAAGGTHVCLARIDAVLIVQCIQDQGITHFACAPVVLYLLLRHSSIENFQQLRRITVATRGASPTSRLIESMEKLGFDLIHLYSLTESFSPTSLRLLSAVEEKLKTDEKAKTDDSYPIHYLLKNRLLGLLLLLH